MGDMSVLILDLGPLKASYPRLDGIWIGYNVLDSPMRDE